LIKRDVRLAKGRMLPIGAFGLFAIVSVLPNPRILKRARIAIQPQLLFPRPSGAINRNNNHSQGGKQKHGIDGREILQ
jgi:hypothetical protein